MRNDKLEATLEKCFITTNAVSSHADTRNLVDTVLLLATKTGEVAQTITGFRA